MRPDYQKALEIILKHEGGSKFVNHPNDPGGATAYGISLRWLEEQGIDIDGDGDVDIDDIKALTLPKVEELYHEHFWLPCYEGVDDFYVSTKLFDMAVNMGHERAHKLAQAACNSLGSKLTVDGSLGPLSVGALNLYSPGAMLQALCDAQADFYRDLAQRKPKLAVFLKGWLRRASWPWEN